MTNYLKIFGIIQKIKLTEFINGLIRVIRSIPFIGKFLGDKYKFHTLKGIVYAFYPIFTLILQIIKSTIVFLLLLFYTNIIMNALYDVSNAGLLFFPDTINEENLFAYTFSLMIPMLFYIASAFFRNMIGDNQGEISKFYNTFKFKPKAIAIINLYMNPILRFIARSLVFITAGKIIANMPIWISILLSMSILLYEISSSVFWLNYSLTHKKDLIQNGFFQLVLIIIIYLLLGAFSLIMKISPNIIVSIYFITAVISFYFSYRYMKNFNNYGKLIEEALKNYEIAKTDINKISDNRTNLVDKDLDTGKKINGIGFKYLNNIFFERHKRLIIKPILIKTGIFLVISLLIYIYLKINNIDFPQKINEAAIYFIPIVMYLLCKQDIMLRSMYLNCDQGLMPYGFYRDSKNLLEMFWARVISVLKLMGLPTISAVAVYVLFLREERDVNMMENIYPIILIILSGLFFTVLPLFQYYLFQPFNQEGKPTGKIYRLIDFLVYYLCIFILPRVAASMDINIFVISVSIFILIFIVGANIAIVRFAPKTFKVRY